MFRMTATREDYLKAIHTLDPVGAGTRVVDIAQALSITKASVSRMVGQLEKEGLVERFGKQRVGLTKAGRQQAREVKSRYEVARLYFLEVLGVDYKTAAEEACKLEHVLSDTSLAAMKTAVAQSDDWSELAQLVSA